MNAPPRPRIGIVTGEAAPELTDDGRAVAAGLEARGFQAEPVVWTDDRTDWAAYDAALVRSCWDYHTDVGRFRALLAAMEDAGVTVLNPPSVVRWNVHKSYLRDLQAAGVEIPATTWVERGSDASLEAILREQGWRDAVVKPAVGAASTDVWRASATDAAAAERRFETLVAERDVLVQAFVPEIEDGERSIVFFAGEYSHAWNSPVEPADFSSFRDADATYEPTDAVRDQAAAVLEAARETTGFEAAELPYARVDYVERGGTLLLLELELVEPYLGLERGEDAVETFCDAVSALL